MSFKHIIFSAACVLLLSACGNETSNKSNEVSSNKEEQQQQQQQQPNEQENQHESTTIDEEEIEDRDDIEEAEDELEATEEKQEETDSEDQDVTQNSKNSEQAEDELVRDEGEQDGESGFSVVNGAVEADDDVPKVEEIAILAAFDEYIAAFNAQDLERYEKILAQNPEGFDLEEDLVNSKRIFDNFEVHREAKNVTITEYTGNRAYVYADVIIDVKQDNSSSHDEGKQLTQFVKESSGWKVTSLQAIGSAAKE